MYYKLPTLLYIYVSVLLLISNGRDHERIRSVAARLVSVSCISEYAAPPLLCYALTVSNTHGEISRRRNPTNEQTTSTFEGITILSRDSFSFQPNGDLFDGHRLGESSRSSADAAIAGESPVLAILRITRSKILKHQLWQCNILFIYEVEA